MIKLLLWIFLIAYIVSPVDLMPGVFLDDLVVAVITILIQGSLPSQDKRRKLKQVEL